MNDNFMLKIKIIFIQKNIFKEKDYLIQNIYFLIINILKVKNNY